MKRKSMIGLCLVAVFAMSAVMVASAGATAPEFGRCLKLTGGKFSDAGCKKPVGSGGKYEWNPGAVKNKFTSAIKASTLATLETVGGTKITCTGETGVGEFTGVKTVGGVLAHFTGCTSGGLPCENVGKEKIDTKVLNGQLGVEKIGTKTPENDKLAVNLEGPGGGPLAEFSCSGAPVVVTGSVLHPVTTNSMKEETTEKFTAAKGEQKPDKFAKGTTDEHTLFSCLAGCGGTPEEAGQTITAIVHGEEKLEASSVN